MENEFFGRALELVCQISLHNGYLIGYQGADEIGMYTPLAIVNENLTKHFPPMEGTVAGWKHPGWENGTYDPAEGWFVQNTPEGSIILSGS